MKRVQVALIKLQNQTQRTQKTIQIKELLYRYHYYNIQLNQLDQYEEAIKCFDRALQINPQNFEIYYNKGISLQKLTSTFRYNIQNNLKWL